MPLDRKVTQQSQEANGLRRRTMLGCALLMTGTSTAAQSSPEVQRTNPGSIEAYGVFSLVGDGLEIVSAGGAATSRVERGSRETQVIPGSGFDRAVLLGARDAFRRGKPTAHSYMYRANSPLSADQQREVVDGLRRGELMSWMRAAIDKDTLTRLLCVTRERGDARLRTKEGFIGSGSVDGVGYYLDRDTVGRTEEGRTVTGFLAPFVYLRVTEVDAKTQRLLRSELITETGTIGISDATPGRDPWNSLSNVEKIETLRSMIQHSVAETSLRLLSA